MFYFLFAVLALLPFSLFVRFYASTKIDGVSQHWLRDWRNNLSIIRKENLILYYTLRIEGVVSDLLLLGLIVTFLLHVFKSL